MLNTLKPYQRNQQGIISIMMTMVMMIVISLIVLGLAEVSRREQQQTQDAQLSTQAFYAAESGVNDAVATITNFTGEVPAKSSCGPDGNYPLDGKIGPADSGVSYSCLLVDPSPPQLVQKLSSEPAVMRLKMADGSALGKVTFSWTPADNATEGVGQCPTRSTIDTGYPFIPTANWKCPYGPLQIDLVPLSSLSRSSLVDNTANVFIVPSRSGGPTTFNIGNQKSSVMAAGCTASACQVTLNGLGGKDYFLRVSELYQTGTLTVTGKNSNARFTGSQVMVDVTGRAQDVLRRVRVAVDITGGNQNATSVGALYSGYSICKRFSAAPGYFYNDDLDASSPNPLCQSQSFITPTPVGGGGVDGGIDGGTSDPGGGGGSGPPWPLSWHRNFHVVKAPPSVNYCIWNFGDGTTKRYDGGDCAPYAVTVGHDYPNPPVTCTHYTVNVTFYYPGGTYKADPYGTYVPHNGDPAVKPC